MELCKDQIKMIARQFNIWLEGKGKSRVGDDSRAAFFGGYQFGNYRQKINYKKLAERYSDWLKAWKARDTYTYNEEYFLKQFKEKTTPNTPVECSRIAFFYGALFADGNCAEAI